MSARKLPFDPEDLDLRKPWLAALLSWLVPGAGQYYQRRYVKAFIFSVCILGSFFYGIALGEGRPVYTQYQEERDNVVYQKRNYGYLSQFLVGASALPAIVQTKRFDSPDNHHGIDGPVSTTFEGIADLNQQADFQRVPLSGHLELTTESGARGPEIRGEFTGIIIGQGEVVDVELEEFHNSNSLGSKIAADPKRKVSLQVVNSTKGPLKPGDVISGSIPRSFVNWYQVPLEDEHLQDLNARLGKRWELAMVFTWIAGLLNILCIWDAFEGPAYGIAPSPNRDNDHEPAKESGVTT